MYLSLIQVLLHDDLEASPRFAEVAVQDEWQLVMDGLDFSNSASSR